MRRRSDPFGSESGNGGARRQAVSLWPELWIYLLLLALGAASLAAAYLPLAGYNLSVNLTVAAIMVAIVLAFFMELRREPTLILITAVAAVLWLAILFTLTMADYVTRAPEEGGSALSLQDRSIPSR